MEKSKTLEGSIFSHHKAFQLTWISSHSSASFMKYKIESINWKPKDVLQKQERSSSTYKKGELGYFYVGRGATDILISLSYKVIRLSHSKASPDV